MRCTIVLVSGFLACASGLAAAAQASAPRSLFGPDTTLADVDRIIDAGKRSTWQVTEFPMVDAEARPAMEADLAEFVFADAALRRIDALRAGLPAARLAGSDKIDPAALAPLELLLEQEECKITAVLMRAADGLTTRQHTRFFEEMAPRLPAARREEFRGQLQAIRAGTGPSREQLLNNVKTCESDSPDLAASALWQQPRALMQEYDKLRVKLAAAVDAAVLAKEIAPLQQGRPTSCPAPRLPIPGSARARVVRNGNPANYYPAEARNAGLEGRVRLKIDVDRGGCVTSVLVLSTSGVHMLDLAAMKMAFDYEFVPAEENGLPRERDAFVLPVTFGLRNWSDAQSAGPGQPQP